MTVNPMLKTIMRSLFQRNATLPFPDEPKKTFPITRGHVEVDMEQCILCGMCGRKCPTGAINVDRAAKTWTIAAYDCCQCSCCVDNCPKKCLRMENTATAPMLEQVTRTAKKPETTADASTKSSPVKKTEKIAPGINSAKTVDYPDIASDAHKTLTTPVDTTLDVQSKETT